MEYVKCNLCGSDDARQVLLARCRIVRPREFFKIVKCGKCGLAYLDPRPDEKEISDYYPSWYHARASQEITDVRKTKIWGVPWRRAMQGKADVVLERRKSGKILDVGCGDGSFLRFMKDSGWQAQGVEINEVSSQYARNILGLDVFTGRIEDADYPAGSFDVITLFHVMEHVHDPAAVLGRIRYLLKNDGLLIMEVPNFDSFEESIFRSRWVGISVPLHLYHFTPVTLKLMLEACGFYVAEQGFVPEKTRYAAGFSESLRFCLIDLGLYHRPGRGSVPAGRNDSNKFYDSSLGSPAHIMEYTVFKLLSDLMNKIGRGSSMFAVSGKKKQ